MKKYAIVPINWRRDLKGKLKVRSVLIYYKFALKHKNIINFYGTKFICGDDYFSSNKATHKYIFSDKWYKLESVKETNEASKQYSASTFKKRRYHYNKYFIYAKDVEFKAKSNEDAIKHFKENTH